MKKIITILIAVAMSISASLQSQEFSSDRTDALRRIADQIEAQNQRTHSSAGFAAARLKIFKQIEREIKGMEKLPRLTPDQLKWVIEKGRLAKKNDPYYRPYLNRLYKLYYKHKSD